MAIPNQTVTILDPGLGIVTPAGSVPLVLGVSSSGTADTLVSVGTKKGIVDTFGQGPLPELACRIMDDSGGPVLCMRLTGSVAGTNGSVTKTAVSTSTGTVTVAGAPYDAYEVEIRIVATGTLGAGTFTYSLDNNVTLSEVITIPSGGTYAVPNTDLTLTFVPGAGPLFFEAGDAHSFDSVAPFYSTTNLASAITALLATTTEFDFIALAGRSAAATQVTIFSALATHMTTLANNFRYARAMMEGASDSTSNLLTEYAAVSSTRILVTYGTCTQTSPKPIEGWGTPKTPILNAVAGRAARSLISTDLGRVADGSLDGITAVSHDERVQGGSLDAAKITTLRSFIGRPGYYITHGLIKSPAGSDYVYWQHGRVMDAACKAVVNAQHVFINTAVRVNDNGTINEKDAARIEAYVSDQVRAVLIDPLNAEGLKGHISDFRYAIDRTNNVLSTSTLIATVAIRPLGYVKFITTQIGFTVNLGSAAA